MIQLLLGLFWGFILGYCVCMIKVTKLRSDLLEIRNDLIQYSNRDSHAEKLSKEQNK